MAGRAVREGAKRRPWRGKEFVYDVGQIRVERGRISPERARRRRVAFRGAENVDRPSGPAILLQEVAFACPIWQIDDPEASMRDRCVS